MSGASDTTAGTGAERDARALRAALAERAASTALARANAATAWQRATLEIGVRGIDPALRQRPEAG